MLGHTEEHDLLHELLSVRRSLRRACTTEGRLGNDVSKGYPMRVIYLASVTIGLLAMTGCSTAPKSQEGKADIEKKADAAVAKAETSDPTLTKALGDAQAYAVFPTVGKGAVGVGGAYGK